MERVTGIGGIFFKARDADALRAWYRRHLGLDIQEWGGLAFPPPPSGSPDPVGLRTSAQDWALRLAAIALGWRGFLLTAFFSLIFALTYLLAYSARFDGSIPAAEWRTVQLPFDHFVAHRTDLLLDTHRLRRIGVVAIGRTFSADLALGGVRLITLPWSVKEPSS